MTDIYTQYAQATKPISGYAIMKGRIFVAKVIFKRGNCRMTAYTHVLGLPMTRAYANGGGYDMASAAVQAAFAKVNNKGGDKNRDTDGYMKHVKKINAALRDDGAHWDSALRVAGYEVHSVV